MAIQLVKSLSLTVSQLQLHQPFASRVLWKRVRVPLHKGFFFGNGLFHGSALLADRLCSQDLTHCGQLIGAVSDFVIHLVITVDH